MAPVLLLEMGMSSEMDKSDARRLSEEAQAGGLVLDGAQAAAMRRLMHELSNVLTGVMISGGLLAQYVQENALRQYAAGVCEGCERGCEVLRELRSRLSNACGAEFQ